MCQKNHMTDSNLLKFKKMFLAKTNNDGIIHEKYLSYFRKLLEML